MQKDTAGRVVMSFLVKLLLVACVAVGVHHFWAKHLAAKSTPISYQANPGEFIHTAMPSGAKQNTVLILAPLNCPSLAAKRADSLAQQLTRMGIPNSRGNNFSLRVNNPSAEAQADMKRAGEVLQGEIPAVFINGMGKANPSAEEVAAVYRRTG
jgi:hypothetical protein